MKRISSLKSVVSKLNSLQSQDIQTYLILHMHNYEQLQNFQLSLRSYNKPYPQNQGVGF